MRTVFLVPMTILCVALLLLRITFTPILGDGLWRCLGQNEQSSCCQGIQVEQCSEDHFCSSSKDCLPLPVWMEAESNRFFDLLAFPPFFDPLAWFALAVSLQNKEQHLYFHDFAYLVLQLGWDHIRLIV
ncbi:MAG: hypothetical protein H3C47_02100 [Candidatus Cloacimonetes bacterium]|nr:hypothetical protein [Candidatus Cloacimonadota bacterium]